MRLPLHPSRRGIALIIVMVAIFTLGILAGGFAYSMKVELRLARNHGSETELEWLGRSGVELASYILAQQASLPEKYDALNQKWAGGTGVTNDVYESIQLENNELGSGVFSIKIVDQERKFNINVADQAILQQALNMLGVDSVEASTIMDSILDWRDLDDDPHMSGAESEYYTTLNPPYYAKNGPFDDINELLLVKDVTPEIFWGRNSTNASVVMNRVESNRARFGGAEIPQYQGGLVDLFTPISGRLININTASSAVLQLLPAIDANIAQAIVTARAGPDGVEGNEDDTPFRNPGELVNVPGMSRQMVGQIQRFFAVTSATFEVTVDTRIGNYRRQYVAFIRRNGRDVQILNFHWK